MTSATGGLSRRVRTLIVCGGLFALLLILTMTLPVPYVILSPGPTCNTLQTCPGESQQIIQVVGHRTLQTSGNLNLTTVSYSTSRLTVFDALRAWIAGDEAVVPRSALFPPGQTTQQVNTENTNEFSASQDDAVVAAACALGYKKAFGVLSVIDKGPSQGILRPGDVLQTVDGKAVDAYPRLKAILSAEKPGTSVRVTFVRNTSPTAGTRHAVTVKLGAPPKGSPGASMGITVPQTPQCLAPYEVNLGLNDEIGGPSAGMMFALGIIDKVSEDLTKGRFIAGTGTISPNGAVGPIGGIQLKMIAARRAGATLFLAPAGNCSDVTGAIPSGLQVVKVSTLRGAIDALRASAKGQPVPSC